MRLVSQVTQSDSPTDLKWVGSGLENLTTSHLTGDGWENLGVVVLPALVAWLLFQHCHYQTHIMSGRKSHENMSVQQIDIFCNNCNITSILNPRQLSLLLMINTDERSLSNDLETPLDQSCCTSWGRRSPWNRTKESILKCIVRTKEWRPVDVGILHNVQSCS